MPYKLSEDGMSVMKEDGTLVKKHDSPEKAKAHLAALEANVNDAKSAKYGATISAANMKKVQGTHDFMVDLGATCGEPGEEKNVKFSLKSFKQYEMTGAEYAIHEGWDIQQCCSVCSQVAAMCQDEIREGEMDEAMLLCNICMSLIDYCKGECQEMMDSINQRKSEGYMGKSFAVPKHRELNLSYVKSIGMDSTKSMAVKFIALNEIKGYTFLWGNPKMTDVEIEYFTQESNFWDDRLGKSARPLTWDHAQDEEFKATPIIGSISDFGDDELGRWYVAKLDTSHKYRKVIDQLIKDGVLGTSSDSAPQYVVREKTGKSVWLKEWPWFASALTNTPAEPRMIGSLEFLKSLGVQLPDVTQNVSRYEALRRQSEFLKLKNER